MVVARGCPNDGTGRGANCGTGEWVSSCDTSNYGATKCAPCRTSTDGICIGGPGRQAHRNDTKESKTHEASGPSGL